MTKLEFETIRESVQKGQQKGLKQLINLYEQAVIQKLCYYNKCRIEDAEEFFQDALLELRKRLLNDRFEYRNKNSVKNFLDKVCRHKFLSKYKKKQIIITLEQMDFDLLLVEMPEAAFDTDERQEESIRKKAMYSALNTFTDKSQQVLKLFYLQQFRLNEIALILGYSSADSVGEVKRRYYNRWIVKTKEIYDQLKDK